MPDELQRWFDQLPAKAARELPKEFAIAVDEELVEPVRQAARQGKTGRLKASVRKEAGDNDLTWIVAAGGELTTKAIGQRSYRRPINIGTGEETQNVARGNAAVVYDYALGEEYGNSHYPGQPFFWPTIRARWGRFRQRVEDKVVGVFGRL